MISNLNNIQRTSFNCLSKGATFVYANKPYLVMDDCYHNGFSVEKKVNAVCLTDGEVAWFGAEVSVYPVYCELNEVK